MAATGRLSSSDPNLQNIPIRSELGRQIRRAFIPGGDEQILLVADYSQIELRILAHLSGDAGLREAFDSGLDIHAATAATVFDLPPEHVDAEMRRRAKAVNYGLAYGMNAWGLATRLGITPDEAQGFIDAYFEGFPAIKEYLDQQVDRATVEGFTETLLGRRRYIPELQAANPRVRDLGRRQALNAPIQGSASDVFKVGMIAVDRALRERPELDCHMLLTVHDELVFEVRKDRSEEAVGPGPGPDGARGRAGRRPPGRRRARRELVGGGTRRPLTSGVAQPRAIDGVPARTLPFLRLADRSRAASQIPTRDAVSPACRKEIHRMSDIETTTETEAIEGATAEPADGGAGDPRDAGRDHPDRLHPEPAGEDYTPEELVAAMEASLNDFNDGDIMAGVVVKIDRDEVLLDIGYKSEGVIPSKELSIRHDVDPNEVVKVGDRIEALVLQKEDKEGRLILSKKRAQYERAWGRIEETMASGQTIKGPVIEVVKGGLILDIGLRGFLPASLVDLRRVRDLQPYIGQELEAKIIELDRNRNNVVLSRRAFLEESQSEGRKKFLENLQKGERRKGTVSSIVNFGAFVDLGGVDGPRPRLGALLEARRPPERGRRGRPGGRGRGPRRRPRPGARVALAEGHAGGPLEGVRASVQGRRGDRRPGDEARAVRRVRPRRPGDRGTGPHLGALARARRHARSPSCPSATRSR